MLSGNMLRVLQMLSEEDMTLERVRKSTRLSERVLESVITALVEKGYISLDGDLAKITEHGKEVVKKTQL